MGINSRSRGAFRTRALPGDALFQIEGTGKAGCEPTPMARLQQKNAGGSHHRYEPDNRPSLRDSWNGCSELSPGTGVLAPVARERRRRLGISTGMPGPHGLTVRTGMFVRVRRPTLQSDAPTASRTRRP